MQPERYRCALCGVRDHSLGGRNKTGDFMLALPVEMGSGRPGWPRIGTNGWCGTADGEVERLTIVRVRLSRSALNGQPAFLCQDCLGRHQAGQGILTDLFQPQAQ
jgi:hypothetical protein